jgi:hypothetical protein
LAAAITRERRGLGFLKFVCSVFLKKGGVTDEKIINSLLLDRGGFSKPGRLGCLLAFTGSDQFFVFGFFMSSGFLDCPDQYQIRFN